MSDFERSQEAFPEESLALAAAMTRRYYEDARETAMIRASIGLESLPAPTEAQQVIQTSLTLLNLERIENPDIHMDPRRIVDAVFNEETLDILAATTGEEFTEEERAQLRDLWVGQLKVVIEGLGLTPSKEIENARRAFDATKKVAKRHGIAPADVYDNDNFYLEMQQVMSGSPLEHATSLVDTLNAITPQFIKEIFLAPVRQEILSDSYLSESERDEELGLVESDFNRALLEDEDLRQIVDVLYNKSRQLVKIKAAMILEHTWGMESLFSLPPELQETLAVTEDFSDAEFKSPDTYIYKTAIHAQRCLDVIKTICMENEWDISSLSQAQLTAIYNSEAWLALD